MESIQQDGIFNYLSLRFRLRCIFLQGYVVDAIIGSLFDF